MSDLIGPMTPEERLKAKAERKALRLARRQAELKTIVAECQLEAAHIVKLRQHAFKSEKELEAAGLTDREKAIVRSWQEPKRMTAFAVEAAARQVEAQIRGQVQASAGPQINVQNAVIELPEKKAPDRPVVVIEVEPAGK